MSRYTGPIYKKSRHLGFSLLETGKELVKRPYGPGQHGNDKKRGKASEYKLQLMEKQKVRLMYGVNEKQFRLTFEKAAKMKGIQGENFLKLLESRLITLYTVWVLLQQEKLQDKLLITDTLLLMVIRLIFHHTKLNQVT